MGKPSPLLWWAILLLLLLPTAAGRFLLDLAGGVMLALFVLPLLLAGLGWIGWRILQSRMVTCPSCGVSTLMASGQCPVCGTAVSSRSGGANSENDSMSSIPASDATIDITAEDAGSES
ncbi:MAG: Uncharacterised protein [Prochlorococcus marinus str. MIT 9215]|nr:MAG: Uncharacterised protein [Prochlorococcus marinus str. MIT 9215]